ncbi:MAG TPA: GumC family protein [Devosia sp.]|uniref:GumC family protein n=1 Tax=Devosia sp. TaxID=1871048 RepID=UPI002F94C8E0
MLFDIRGMFEVLWRRRVLILSTTLACVALALLYIVTTVPSFTATAVLLVDPREAQTTEASSVLPGIGSDSAAISSQVAVIQSREVLEKVFLAEKLDQDPEFSQSGSIPSLIGMITGGSKPPTAAMMFDSFASRLSVEREGLTYIINVSFRSSDPSKAARIANAVVDEYTSRQKVEKATANAEVTDLLTSRISGLQAAVSLAERAVEDYKIKNNLFDSGSGSTQTQARIDQVNSQLVVAQDIERQANTAYEQALAVGLSPAGVDRLAQILSSPSAESLRAEYNARLNALASAQATLGARHPTIVSLAAEVERTERSLIAEAQRITNELKARAEAAAGNVAKLEADLEQLRSTSNLANLGAVELRQLQRDAEAKRAVLDQFLMRSQETGQLESMQLSNARSISPAHPPAQATWPRPSLLLLLATITGFSVGCALALVPRAGKNEEIDVPYSKAEAIREDIRHRSPVYAGSTVSGSASVSTRRPGRYAQLR